MPQNWTHAGRRMLIALPLMLLATGCQTTSKAIPITATIRAIPCDRMAAIRYSAKQDSRVTVDQVRRFNAAFDAVCK